jgi:hypothetical protein
MNKWLLLRTFFLGCMALISCKPIPVAPGTGSSSSGGSGTSTIVILPAKPKSTSISIEWLSPSPADINIAEVGGKVEIRLRISSAEPIDPEQIDIYINGKLLGNKADEVSLMKRAEFKDQILTMHVPVALGNNAIQVVVTRDAEQRFFAERILMKNESGVIIKPAPVTGNTRITWAEPDVISLEGAMYATKTKELPVKLNITSPENLKKDQIQILHNRQYFNPSSSASLVGQSGAFVFKDVVMLDEEADINEVAIRLNTFSGTVESEYLKINYSPLRPNFYLLSIGSQLNLKYAYKDARDFARLYSTQSHQYYKLFNSILIDTLIGNAATTNEIRGMVETIRNKFRTGQIAEDDVVMLFISSHGFLDEKGDFRIQGSDYIPERRMTTSVSYQQDILAHMETLPCKKLIFIDACHSGGARANTADLVSAIHDLRNAPRGFAILTSSSKDEESYEDIKWQNGAFTEAILKGLKEGMADINRDGIITLIELEAYLKREVPQMVNLVKNKPQNPKLTRNDIGDIPIYINP